MMGGRISSSTSCGASVIGGRPGMRASTTPVTTSRMAGGIFSFFASDRDRRDHGQQGDQDLKCRNHSAVPS